MGVAYVGVHISKHLKEELAWDTDNWLQVISNVVLLVSYATKELKNKAFSSLNNVVCIATRYMVFGSYVF